MSHLRTLYELIQAHRSDVTLGELLERHPNLMRCCELELGNDPTVGIEIPANCVIKTQMSSHHEDLPWDAYLYENGRRFWADGWTEMQAIRKVLKKESELR